jgi:hypothetical protein
VRVRVRVEGRRGLALVHGYAEHLGEDLSSTPRLERFHSETIQELTDINPGLPQQTSEGADLDRLVEGNDTTPVAAAHHHVASVLTYGYESQPLQRADDLPTGKVRELRHERAQ